MYKRNLGIIGIVSITLLSGVLLAFSRTDHDGDFGAVMTLWADLVRDVDRVGLTATRVSDEREMRIGYEISRLIPASYQQSEQFAARQDYLTQVGQSLVIHAQRQGIRYRFHLVASPIVNAFAIPGGHIYVTTGMIDFVESEAELAGIIGHEISHIDRRHCIERLQYELVARKIGGRALGAIAKIGYGLVALGFSEQQELEADANGAILAAKAGYDPRAGAAVFQRLALRHAQEVKTGKRTLMVVELGAAVGKAIGQYFETHPPSAARVRLLVTLYERNTPAWSGETFYSGRSNHVDRVPRAESSRLDEWIIYDGPPNVVECHLSSGLVVPLSPDECALTRRPVEARQGSAE